MDVDKSVVVQAIQDRIQEQLDGLIQMTAMARDEATGGESKAENKYDTRALEASYLAAGQGQRLAELRTSAAWYQTFDPHRVFSKATVGALLGLEGDAGQRWLFLAPSGGIRVHVNDIRIDVVSPQSPVGRALLGRQCDEEVTLHTPGGAETLEILYLL